MHNPLDGLAGRTSQHDVSGTGETPVKMAIKTYQIRFLTPAFLGNAEQDGQWRTPPFKALLRQWWRVAWAADKHFPVSLADMRHDEGKLFGNAWLSRQKDGKEVSDHNKSAVKIRLDHRVGDRGEVWSNGTQQGVAPLPARLDTSYAWFGLINRGVRQKDRTAIKAVAAQGAAALESTRTLRMAFPDEYVDRIEQVMRLINAFGMLGSRNRGGWGALHIESVQTILRDELSRYEQPLNGCLKADWAMSLLKDADGVCVWHSKPVYENWNDAMQFVAGERKRIRQTLKTVAGKDLRTILGFATPGGRMPSPLRWKIIPAADSKLALRVFAMPHQLPPASPVNLTEKQLMGAWQTVCGALDNSRILSRGNWIGL